MSVCTEQQLKNFLSGAIDSVASDTISIYLSDALIEVSGRGISTGHARFNLLQRLYACHLMQIGGVVSGGDITSESVGDVSISYGDSGSQTKTSGLSSWEQLYNKEIEKVLGTCRRIL